MHRTPMRMALSLDEIGQKYGTDKMTGVSAKMHGYLPQYEFFFRHLRDDPVTLCEIGVYKGASLSTWRDYFSRGQIIGIDINQDTLQYRGDRVDVEIVDQANKVQLAAFAQKYGPFDIVIDDGSHRWDHQRISVGPDPPRKARWFLRDRRHSYEFRGPVPR